MYKTLLLTKDNQKVLGAIAQLEANDYPDTPGVDVEVLYSSINYKDALAVTGRGKIIRGDYPFVAGIDAVGRLVDDMGELASGTYVVITGWGIGENLWGGFSQRIRVKPEWIVPLPERLEPIAAATIGTAGFTAMLSVMALEEHGVVPADGPIVVTGATGGVGSFAILILSQLGYDVTASTGKNVGEYLHSLGATDVIDREELSSPPANPMLKARWAGGIDVVGSDTLARLIAETKRHGCIASCGLAGGPELVTTVFPFILRGVSLIGIDSNTCPIDRRSVAWDRLSDLTQRVDMVAIRQVIALDNVVEASERLLAGSVIGRIVVDLSL